MSHIPVLLADDRALFPARVAGFLAAESDFEIVGEAADGSEAVEMACSLFRRDPDGSLHADHGRAGSRAK